MASQNRTSASDRGKVIPDLPDQTVTIGTPTDGNTGTTVNVAFTPGNVTTGGLVSTYQAVSNPGSITSTSPTSPILVSGLTPGTSYTFQVAARNNSGISTAGYSNSSNSVTPAPVYNLTQTFNAGGTFTVPSGKTKMAVYMIAAGGAGGTAPKINSSAGNGGAGGGGGRVYAFSEYTVTPGATYTVTIGASGGNTSFGNLVTLAPGNAGGAGTTNASGNPNGGTTGNITTNNITTGAVNAAGGSGGFGAYGDTGGGTYPSNGGNGGNGSNVTLNQTGLITLQAGGGGGGGGGGAYSNSPLTTGANGGTGGNSGGAGGQGGNAHQQNATTNNGVTGTAGTQPGGGGGGTGGNSYSPINGTSSGNTTVVNGGSARVIVYTKEF